MSISQSDNFQYELNYFQKSILNNSHTEADIQRTTKRPQNFTAAFLPYIYRETQYRPSST